ncbi:MAG TPA: tetratricopeptide repeat protein [Polyangiaceae bacterium]|nr:tetratricopeptide repeat protein [Polyangiaceae bacterium]
MSRSIISRVRGVALVTGLAAVIVSSPVAAEEPTAPAEQVRKDPQGIKGISPYWEAIREGDGAYVARDYPAAIAAFKRAVGLMPQKALAHYRLGQALLASGATAEAEQAYQAALRFAEDPTMKAKALFVLADLRERQRDLPGAAEGWTAYSGPAQAPGANGYPATATARKAAIARWQETEAGYAKVKERIAARVAEADKSLQKSSQ